VTRRAHREPRDSRHVADTQLLQRQRVDDPGTGGIGEELESLGYKLQLPLVWESTPHAAHRLRVDQVYLADALARGTLRDLRAYAVVHRCERFRAILHTSPQKALYALTNSSRSALPSAESTTLRVPASERSVSRCF
jgi:hypothetical protein